MRNILLLIVILSLLSLTSVYADSIKTVKIVDGNGNASYDTTTAALNTIDYAHHEIHEGNHFKGGTQDLDIDTNQTLSYCLTTSDTTTWVHYQLTAQATGAVTVELYENPTIETYGAAITTYNRNRNSSNVASATMSLVTNATNNGTKLSSKWIGGTGFKTSIGDELRADSEFVLKQNEQYLVVLTANADDCKVSIGADWYEHTNKE
jgi:hypothetical protein